MCYCASVLYQRTRGCVTAPWQCPDARRAVFDFFRCRCSVRKLYSGQTVDPILLFSLHFQRMRHAVIFPVGITYQSIQCSPVCAFFQNNRRGTALSAGQEIQVEWLYVGRNTLFDIYVRQGEQESSARVSENLCSGEPGGSCTGANVGSATVTIPAELEDGTNYLLLVVDKKDDDAYGMSRSLSIGISVASAGSGSGTNTAANIGIVIGSCVGGEKPARLG